MGMGNYQKSKFVFSEVFNNKDGKTSGSGFIGVIMGLVGCLSFVAAIVGYFLKIENTIDFMQQTIFFIGAATVLLGARKIGSIKSSPSLNEDLVNKIKEKVETVENNV